MGTKGTEERRTLVGRAAATAALVVSALLLGLPATSAVAAPACPDAVSISPDGTTVYAGPCTTEIVVTSPEVTTIYGGPGDNVIHAGPEVEAIFAGEGNDVVFAGPEVELIQGGGGEDVIYGEPTEVETGIAETELTPTPTTVLRHARKQRRLPDRGGEASASIFCEESPCLGGNGGQKLYGGEGADQIFGERGDDELFGEGGNDALYSGVGDDAIYGGNGADFIAGGPGTDELKGESGNDLIRGDGTIDKIWGGANNDTVSFATAVTPGFEFAYPSGSPYNIKAVEGFPGAENGEGRGVFVRLDGNPTSCGFPSCDNGAALGGGADETISEIENVIGSPFPDIIVGSGEANKIYGGGGGDVLIGAGGADQIYGGAEGDYIENNGEGTAFGGQGTNNCVNITPSGTCGASAKVSQHEAGTMSVGFMLNEGAVVAHNSVYLVGSEGADYVNASISGSTVTFSSYGSTTFAGESEGCAYESESKVAKCTLPAGTSAFDSIVMAGMKGEDKLAVGGGGFALTTSPQLLGGEGVDTLTGSATTEDVLVDGNGNGADTEKGYGYDDWLLNNEGKDTLEGGAGNDLFLSSRTCDEDTLNGAEAESGGDGEAKNNASWAKMPVANGGVTASLSTQTSGNSWNEGAKAPACSAGSPDHLYGFDDLEGSNQGDALFGNSAANVLLGHKGQDTLGGEAGNDTLSAQGDGEKDKLFGGAESDECRLDTGVDEPSGCETISPEVKPTASTPSVTPVNGQPGSVTAKGKISASSGVLTGLVINVNFQKETGGGGWETKFTKQPAVNASGNYETPSEGAGVGKWRVRTVVPEQLGFQGAESAYETFTISPTGYSTATFITIIGTTKGSPGTVSLEGHVNVTSPEGGPINGLTLNVNYAKETGGGGWEYKFTDTPTITNGAYSVSKKSVGVGNWRAKGVFLGSFPYLASESEWRNFTISK